MGDLIQHGLPCKECSSSDAMAEYTTNYFCFSCETSFKKSLGETNPHLQDPEARHNGIQRSVASSSAIEGIKTYVVPFYSPIPQEAKDYLNSYGITEEECETYKIRYTKNFYIYSERKKEYVNMGPRVVFRYGPNKWDLEARSLDPNDKMKYITVGNKNYLFKTFTKSYNTVIIVEDILSAIKVGRVMPCIALRGTNLNKKQKSEILKLCKKRIGLWLDSDGAGRVAAGRIFYKFIAVRQVKKCVSKHDPKCYTKRAIKEKLENEQLL